MVHLLRARLKLRLRTMELEMEHSPHARVALLCALTLAAARAPASDPGPVGTPSVPQAGSDAWWTGPLLAPSAATLPSGQLYVEPYLFDSRPYARLDASGRPHSVPHEDDLGSLTYLNYGITDRLTAGVIPRVAYVWAPDGASSTRPAAGDMSVQAQYRITQFEPGSLTPTFSLNLQESLPAGRYDRLERPSDGSGSGAWTTTLGAYFQSYFWMPDGRILRSRLDLSYALPDHGVPVNGESVYGTSGGFHGWANPGDSAVVDLAFEYSATRSWVLACDFWLEWDGRTRIAGSYALRGGGANPYFSVSSAGGELFVAPALEYNWSNRAGVIFGVRVTAAGRNEIASVTPVAAFSYFL